MTEDRAISLNAVIKAVDQHTNDDGTLDDDISCILEDLPPVTPQPKTGHWIIHNESITLLTGNSATGGVICSECGYKTYNRAHVIFGCPYKYCPSCGTEMIATQERSE